MVDSDAALSSESAAPALAADAPRNRRRLSQPLAALRRGSSFGGASAWALAPDESELLRRSPAWCCCREDCGHRRQHQCIGLGGRFRCRFVAAQPGLVLLPRGLRAQETASVHRLRW